jgi:hypothetical protein
MQVGDLVRFKSSFDRTSTRYPYKREVGIVLRFQVYHPVVFFPSATKVFAKSVLEVIYASNGRDNKKK